MTYRHLISNLQLMTLIGVIVVLVGLIRESVPREGGRAAEL